jgi:hypothetical protein
MYSGAVAGDAPKYRKGAGDQRIDRLNPYRFPKKLEGSDSD